ncbi:Serine/threonine-protein kinase plk1 [Entomophthora muscae]|nr:Serine/threonine-protein kinase plk1 [Entomophthora muscae]
MLTDAIVQVSKKTDAGIFIKPKMVSVLHDKKNEAYFHIGKSIGEGSFATCYEVTLASTGQSICCKALWKAKFQGDDKKQRVNAEVAILRSLKHPNIVKHYSSMEDRDFVYHFMEICRHGSLQDLISRRKKLTEPEVRFYMLQILKAVAHLKKNQIIHRDLKLANIFIAEDMTLKIGDFGLAGKPDSRDDRTIWCGTLNYIAPEVLDQEVHSYEVDMWALGIIM